MSNPEVGMSLDNAVAEVLTLLTGLDVQYQPELDTYQVITRFLNQATRRNALEHEWSYYSGIEVAGITAAGDSHFTLRHSVRPRLISDDSIRLTKDGVPVIWAYVLPRDALHKYIGRTGLWVAVTRQEVLFSRPIQKHEEGLTIEIPVMREPTMFRLPPQPEDPDEPLVTVPQDIRDQLVDFDFPDVIIARAAYLYAQASPVYQPRAQTLEKEYKDLMYQLIERDDAYTDAPFLNEWTVPIASDIYGGTSMQGHRHPHADERGA